MSWLLNILYLLVAVPLIPLLIYKLIRSPRYRENIPERLGYVPRRQSEKKCLWIHGVSGGEIPAARHLIELFEQNHPDWEVVLSTTTKAGRTKATELFPEKTIFYYPLDFSWMINRTIRRVRPHAVVLLELELWPNFIREMNRKEIPVFILNGRLTERGLIGHRKLRCLMGAAYRGIAAFGVQTEIYARRIKAFGVEPDRVHITGTMKYDNVITRDFDCHDTQLAAELGLTGATVIVAGSTHGTEEATLLDVFEKCRLDRPNLKLVLAPRKPDRFQEVAGLIRQRGFRLLRRTQTTPGSLSDKEKGNCEVVLIDTFGELGKIYTLADIVFVGRSLVPLGGSNIMEPAALSKPVLFGPYMDNFADEAAKMLAKEAAVQVTDGQSLYQAMDRFLGDPQRARAMGQRARTIVDQSRGASQQSLSILQQVLGITD